MNKMIARTALVATLALSALSLSACGTSNDCAHAADANPVTATTAMLPTKGGHGGGHATGHSTTRGGATSTGGHGFVWPHWFGGSHSDKCENPTPATKP